MKTTLNKDQFISEFRSIRPDNFSYEALETLFEYFEMMENDCDFEMEFDPIAICCEYTEMTIDEIYDAYPDVLDLIDMDRPRASTYSIIVDYLCDHGAYCGDTSKGTFVFQQF